MSTAKLSSKAVGSVVKLNMNGTARNFIVVHQGLPSDMYDSSCDGTWLLLEDLYEALPWDKYLGGFTVVYNDYENSSLHTILNNDYIALFDSDIQAVIKTVKIPYRPGYGIDRTANSGADGLAAQIFLLSAPEVGFSSSSEDDGAAVDLAAPGDGDRLDYFLVGAGTAANAKRVAALDGTDTIWWTRSPYCIEVENLNNRNVCTITETGEMTAGVASVPTNGVRPALVMPGTMIVDDDGTVRVNTAPSTPGSITVPSSIMGGTSITVSWSASTDAESNLEGYVVEKSTDGGSSWNQIYQGLATSATNTVAFGTVSVMYRVKAYDTEGLESGYKTSSQIEVVNNTAPTAPASITVPNDVKGGSSITITWSASTDADGNLSGYILERSVDGGSFAEVYDGTALSYADAITKGWESVAYRVKAYDPYASSAYATSSTRTVDNNAAPVITCAYASGSDLGTKSACIRTRTGRITTNRMWCVWRPISPRL